MNDTPATQAGTAPMPTPRQYRDDYDPAPYWGNRLDPDDEYAPEGA